MPATAQARTNIALVKYWGKRDSSLNLPAAGSLSITLDALWTRTEVDFDRTLDRDVLSLNDAPDAPALARVSACLDILRRQAGTHCYGHVQTNNNFPTAAGLASSASGFAALVMAAAAALDLPLERRALSALARRGSGSAARSLFGGFVMMHAGSRIDGSDAYADPLLAADAWPLSVVIAVTTQKAKAVGSAAGMERSRVTSPFHAVWIASVDEDLAAARAAVAARDFEALARVSEHSCLKMHAVMLSSQPALVYWTAATLACIHRIRALREEEGVDVFFTIDAGPQVKAVCLPQDASRVAAALAAVPGVEDVLTSGLGAGAELLPQAEVA
jgi:diphosphomevalonate decarboxylase